LPKTQLHVQLAASEYQAMPAIPASTVDESQNQRNALQVSANFRARDLPV